MGQIMDAIKKWQDDVRTGRMKQKQRELNRLENVNKMIRQEKLIDIELEKAREEYKSLNTKDNGGNIK